MSWRRQTTLVACALVAIMFSVPPTGADATPFATTSITPTMSACGQPGLTARLRCGAAYTAEWLRHAGARDVVRETVLTQPSPVGAWRSSTTGGLCGFISVGRWGFGAHHCDRTTFIVPERDSPLIRSDVDAIVVLAHESGHGMQERAGLDPVAVTLSGDDRRLYPFEQYSDCWAGAAMAWYVDRRMLTADSASAGRALLRRVGSPRQDSLGHGTPEQRVEAFDAGIHGGRAACRLPGAIG